MLYAEKGNKVKEIDESMIESCVEQGYKIVDERGNLIKDTIPTDLPTLKLAYKKHEQTISDLKAKIEALESEVQELKSKQPADNDMSTSKAKRTAKAKE